MTLLILIALQHLFQKAMITIRIVFTPADDQGLLRLVYLNIPKLRELFGDEINVVPETDILNDGPPYIELMNKKIYINEINEDIFEVIKKVISNNSNIPEDFIIFSIKRDKLLQDGVCAY